MLLSRLITLKDQIKFLAYCQNEGKLCGFFFFIVCLIISTVANEKEQTSCMEFTTGGHFYYILTQ